MIQIDRRRSLACHHEGGHALTRWYFGFDTDRVVVLTIKEVLAGAMITNRKGYRVQCEGICEGNDIHTQPYGPNGYGCGGGDQDKYLRWRTLTRDVELINCLAGPYAEAAYSNIPVTPCLRSGGRNDLKVFNAILNDWGLGVGTPEYRIVRRFVSTSAKALVRSPKGAAAIRSIAEMLLEHGKVEGEVIDALCQAAYGQKKLQFAAWSDHSWPPTLAQIKAGHIPDRAARS